MKKALFIDRDGTIVEEPSDFQIDSFEKLKFREGVLTWLGRISRETDYRLVIVTNQDGLGTDSFPEEDFLPVHELMLKILEGEGIVFDEVLIDRTFEHEGAPTRKPQTGMLARYVHDTDFDMASSYVIGDRESDVQLAENLGSKAIFLRGPHFGLTDPAPALELVASNWEDVARFLISQPRSASRRRKTNETDIAVSIVLDGRGVSAVSTGVAFLDHMLEQFARHGGFDLDIRAAGDLHIDEHHTVEDVAITLGEAFGEALGGKRGIGRYGFALPMDDCLAQVAVDLGGRSWCEWEAEFRREMIGDMPTEMFFHFFKSFSDKALCNINVKAEGTNEHHKIEAIFKAFARALKMAVSREGGCGDLPTTKGVL